MDTGATGFAFLDKDFATRHSLPLHELETPHMIDIIDGQPIDLGAVTEIALLGLHIHGHEGKEPFFVTTLEHYSLWLGIPWMQLQDVAIRFSYNSLTFGSSYCAAHYTQARPRAVVAEGISIPLPDRPTPRNPVAMISAFDKILLVRKLGVQIHALTLDGINQAIEAKTTDDEWNKQIPLEYHEFLDLFDEKLDQELPL